MYDIRDPLYQTRSVQAIAKHDLYGAELQGQVAKYEHLYRLNPTLADHAMASEPGHLGTPSLVHPPKHALLPAAAGLICVASPCGALNRWRNDSQLMWGGAGCGSDKHKQQ
jgi:hypothetical protein